MDSLQSKGYIQKLKDLSVRSLARRKDDEASFLRSVLVELTSFLPEDTSIAQRMWHIKSNNYNIQKCIHCDVGDVTFYPAKHAYNEFCSKECRDESPIIRERRAKTNVERFGTENPFQSEEIKEKIKETNLERYGVEWGLQSPEIMDKVVGTNLDRYGVENPFQSEEFKEKIKETNIEKYGVENASQSPEIREKTVQTNIERYGVENPSQLDEFKEKARLTNIERYGVEWTLQSEEVRAKGKQTSLDKFGFEHASQSDEIKEKVKETNLERFGKEYYAQTDEYIERVKETNLETYGVEWAIQAEETRAKIKTTNLERYGVEYPLQSPEVYEKVKQTNLERFGTEHANQKHISEESMKLLSDVEFLKKTHHGVKRTLFDISKEIGISNTTLGRYFKNYGIEVKKFFSSTPERDICSFLESNGISYSQRVKHIIGSELDIYIPDHNLAIEYDGLYWHSELRGKDKYYHKLKTDLCREKGIRLIHIFEDEWLEKEDLIKEKILSILGKSNKEKVFARKTKVAEVDTRAKIEFFDKNHIQGNGPSSINFGLEYNNELVAVLGFIKQKDHYVLNRYATSKNVVGGFTKLLKHFEREYNNPKIITFADLRWSEGDLYENTGFILDKTLEPDYYWCKGNKRHHKFSWRHVGMKRKLEYYDPDLTEIENMHNHGFYRIWDCGKLRYIKNER